MILRILEYQSTIAFQSPGTCEIQHKTKAVSVHLLAVNSEEQHTVFDYLLCFDTQLAICPDMWIQTCFHKFGLPKTKLQNGSDIFLALHFMGGKQGTEPLLCFLPFRLDVLLKSCLNEMLEVGHFSRPCGVEALGDNNYSTIRKSFVNFSSVVKLKLHLRRSYT